jgi:hypothetical protein
VRSRFQKKFALVIGIPALVAAGGGAMTPQPSRHEVRRFAQLP